MKSVLAMAAAACAALLVVAAAVFAFGDRETFVSPPDAVTEGFVRALSTGRYDVARQYLHGESPLSREDVRMRSDTLRARAGAINSVDVHQAWMEGDKAIVVAVISTSLAGELSERIELARQQGVWRVVR